MAKKMNYRRILLPNIRGKRLTTLHLNMAFHSHFHFLAYLISRLTTRGCFEIFKPSVSSSKSYYMCKICKFLCGMMYTYKRITEKETLDHCLHNINTVKKRRPAQTTMGENPSYDKVCLACSNLFPIRYRFTHFIKTTNSDLISLKVTNPYVVMNCLGSFFLWQLNITVHWLILRQGVYLCLERKSLYSPMPNWIDTTEYSHLRGLSNQGGTTLSFHGRCVW